jgi:hypothetical protein
MAAVRASGGRAVRILAALLVLLVGVVLALLIWRAADGRAASRARTLLAAAGSFGRTLPERFDPSLVAHLPEPARRYFEYTILPGTPLATVAEITMTGEIGLGSEEDPRYLPMRAEQILAPPRGFFWEVSAGGGLMRMSGSDGLEGGRSWTRFWLLGLAPVVRSGGNEDHWKSAFGRVVADGVFWVPAALLPQNGVSWERVDDDTARATVTHRGMIQTVDVRVDSEGRPVVVSFPRWTDANPDGVFRVQPFGGELSEFREFEGYRLPTRAEAGNFFGTDDYFPFFKARVSEIRFPAGEAP